ncbi:MAG: ATP-dependent sacrificial sulfur transferase LarE [Candidatus Hodarchaeota archaeon]
MMNRALEEKIEHVKELLQGKSALVAFSGGVDSTVVLQLAREACLNVIAVTADSATVPSSEIEEAKEIAMQIGVDDHIITEYDELEEEGFALNPPNRCYICKKGLFSELLEIAETKRCDLVLEGTNASDLGGHRPGFDALQELGVLSPLMTAGISKDEVREIARSRNLSVSEKPAMACLSSRVPYGSPITEEKLKRIGETEKAIKLLQLFRMLRVRDHEDTARIEIGLNEFDKILDPKTREKVVEAAKKAGYRYAVLDLEGYRPSTPK